MNTIVQTAPERAADSFADPDVKERAARRAREIAAQEARAARRDAVSGLVMKTVPPVLGFVLFVLVWHGIATLIPAIPTPGKTWDAAVPLFTDPFYSNGPNDQGIGWNVLASLARVAAGFGLAAVVGIPAGFILGRFAFLNAMMAPVISLLRPVSPLAWLPIGLLLFKAANPAAIWAIFICSIWPMIINTAVGVTRVPQDYLNVARVLDLSEWQVFRRVLFPAVLPYMLTGVRLSIGTAWLVIVAAEMLTGGTGIGFWLWDEWNNLKVEHIVIAIFIIGVVGLILEHLLLALARRFSYGNN
ncbi:nitrate ABC transporter permease [Cupriavidus pampae]|uniref:Bicarbonate transport system permease protein CmpB n=1 Tax=Cupriavidus pampae TaxID=659251 RepID=A0ABN7Y9Y5_9BURK|nr:Bicarbonate transport system permease protein CmpB [Cupriavidus pampae]